MAVNYGTPGWMQGHLGTPWVDEEKRRNPPPVFPTAPLNLAWVQWLQERAARGPQPGQTGFEQFNRALAREMFTGNKNPMTGPATAVRDFFTKPVGGEQGQAAAPQAPPFVPSLPQAGVSPPPAPASSSTGTLNPNALRIAQELRAAGYSDVAIAGVLGNGMQESGFNPTAVGDSGTSFGAFQWRDPTPGQGRQTNLREFAARNGLDPNDIGTQAQFLVHELGTTEGRAGEALRGAQSPEDAAAAFLHFERPKGYNPENFNPAAVHGWGNRSEQARQLYSQLTGTPLPPLVESYQAGLPPAVPDPIDRPVPSAPSFTEQNQWLEQARPLAADPALMQQAGWKNLLAGIATGAANTDVNRTGGVAQMWANMGAGATGAAAENAAAQLASSQQQQEALRDYALRRAGFAGQQGSAMQDWRTAAADVGYGNLAADQEAGWETTRSQWLTEEANRKARFDAEQANRTALQDWGRPREAHISSEGVATHTPGQGYSFQPFQSSKTFEQRIKNYEKLPPVLQQREKYDLMAETGADELDFATEILKDAVADNTAAILFPEQYAAAAEAVDDMLDPALLADPETYQEARQSALAAQLLQTVPNFDWIPRAAALGNYGARLMIPANGR